LSTAEEESLTGRDVAVRVKIKGRGIHRSDPSYDRLQFRASKSERGHSAWRAFLNDVANFLLRASPKPAAGGEGRPAIRSFRRPSMTGGTPRREDSPRVDRLAGYLLRGDHPDSSASHEEGAKLSHGYHSKRATSWPLP
jgi:hypothetical protein